MSIVSYRTEIQENGAIAIPANALMELGAKPGDSLLVQLESAAQPTGTPAPGSPAAMLAILDDIETWHESRPFTTDGSDTDRLLREARSGAMIRNDDSD